MSRSNHCMYCAPFYICLLKLKSAFNDNIYSFTLNGICDNIFHYQASLIDPPPPTNLTLLEVASAETLYQIVT